MNLAFPPGGPFGPVPELTVASPTGPGPAFVASFARAAPTRPARRAATAPSGRGGVDDYRPGGPHVIRPARAARTPGPAGDMH